MSRLVFLFLCWLTSGCAARAQTGSFALPWSGHGHDPQHTGLSPSPSKPMQQILWNTPVDEHPQYTGTTLYAHYGSVLVTRQNTVIIPVKTGAYDGFRVEARDVTTGLLKWSQPTDYSLPPHNWVPHYSIALTPGNRVCFAGAGGTVRFRDAADSPAGATGQLVFYGMANYAADSSTFDATVKINTAITSDRYGNIYFGFLVGSPVALPGGATLRSGIARIGEDGTGSWAAATDIAADGDISQLVYNQAPALGNDHKTLYIAVSNGSGGYGYLVALDSRTLETRSKVRLKDALSPAFDARLLDDGTASPMVGPDGDVYFGAFENSYGVNHYRGWLLHFDGTLSVTKTPGAFGWDHTPSVVPASLVPSYHGTSEYLLICKYNNYAGVGGNGVNRIAVLDPDDSMTDPVTGASVMKEVISVVGPTPDDEYAGVPGAVREWCVNTIAVDPFTHSAIVPSEDGKAYRWDFHSNSLTESITFPQAIGEAYTPTTIGVDGTVFVISNATLFAIGGAVP